MLPTFQYCLSNDPNKPCHILTFKEVTMMLDCGLSMQSVLNFLPLSFVPTNRLLNLPHWMPPDVPDPDLEGVILKLKIALRNHVFIMNDCRN